MLLENLRFSLYSTNGVFSKNELDNASKLLIESFLEKTKGDVLDLGCGIGVVGITLQKKEPNLNVTYTDVNSRALEVVRKNLRYHDLEGTVIQSDAFTKINKHFDYILTNPPMAAGRDKCYEFITSAKTHLKKEGTLGVVARHNKGGKMLKKKMKEVFSNVEEVQKSGGFRVYKSIN